MKRRPTPSRLSFEELEIRTADGVSLRATVDEAEGELRGTVVLAHALFCRKTSFGPTTKALAAKGFRTIAFDFRGHGESTGEGAYDAFVENDIPTVVECARARAEDKPVVIVGHSLGAHVSLAAQGTGKIEADAIVVIGGAPWVESFEPSRALWLGKRGVIRALLEVAQRRGRFPARALRQGSDDESLAVIRDLSRFAHEGWKSRASVDYLAALSNVKTRIVSLTSRQDRICRPSNSDAMVEHCRGRVNRIVVANESHVSIARSSADVLHALETALA